MEQMLSDHEIAGKSLHYISHNHSQPLAITHMCTQCQHSAAKAGMHLQRGGSEPGKPVSDAVT